MSIVWMEDAKCYKASIQRGGIRYQEYFSIKEYGSKKNAEGVAIEWEKKNEKELGAPLTTKNIKTNRNKSGTVGVRLDKNITRRKTGKRYVYWRWIAFWPGLPGGTAWAIGINKYSDNDAFVLACLSRKYESTDREKILSVFRRIRHTDEYKEILKQKKQSPK